MSRNGWTLIETLFVVAIVGIIAAVVIPSIRYTAPAPQQSAIKFEKAEGALTASYDMKAVETVGNHSWMPLNINSRTSDHNPQPAEYRLFILSALLAFEKEHPELEVVSWKIEQHQYAVTTESVIYGLWIDHRPREQK